MVGTWKLIAKSRSSFDTGRADVSPRLSVASNGTGKLIIEKRKPNMWFVNEVHYRQSTHQHSSTSLSESCEILAGATGLEPNGLLRDRQAFN
jgi:hypothetical protein